MQNNYTYSRGEREVMGAALEKHFGFTDPSFKSRPEVQSWMTDAAVAIVEYDKSLDKEDGKGRDQRMEIVGVYDGQISDLVSYLRYLYPEHKALTKWALIFEVYNKIVNIHELYERVFEQVDLGTSEEPIGEPHGEEELGTEHDDSTGVMHASEEIKAESEKVSERVMPAVAEPQNNDVPQISEPTPTAFANDASVAQVAESCLVTPSGNAQAAEVDVSINREDGNTVKKEETNMSAVSDLLEAAKGASGEANAAEVQNVPSANVATPKKDMKAVQAAVSAKLGGEKESRNAWTRGNVVTELISPMRPAAARRLEDEGTISTETDSAKLTEAVKGKILGFIAACSGKKGITVEQFEALTDQERYANVVIGSRKVNDVEVSNVDKAKAIYELLKQVQNNPTMKIPAYFPKKLSYPVKGYAVNSQPMPTDEFIVLLCDKSNGAIYAAGGTNADGTEVENATSFRVGTAKKVERAQAAAITTQKVEKRIPVIRGKNKAAFTEDEKHVMFLFQKEDTNSEGKAAFRAAINVNGVMDSAGVTVYALDDAGNKQVISHNEKDNTDRYKTRQAAVSVSVKVKRILKEFAPEFKGEDDAAVAAARWNVSMGMGKATGDFCNIKEFSQTPVFDVFAQVYAGNVVLGGALKNSGALKTLRAAADAAAAEEAAEAAESLS